MLILAQCLIKYVKIYEKRKFLKNQFIKIFGDIYNNTNNNDVDSSIYNSYSEILSSSRFDLQQKIMDDNG